MTDIHTITKSLGPARIAARLGHRTVNAIGNAERAGVYPATWFQVIQTMAMEAGLGPVPMSLFGWRKPKQEGRAA